MATKVSNRGTCDCCEDKNLVLRNNYGKKMCGKCAAMYSNVRNYLPIVEMALAELWPDKYGPDANQLATRNPEAVKVVVDERTEAVLKRIASLVGYEGDDPEEMADLVVDTVVENQQLWKEREDQGRDGLAALRIVTDQLVRREAALFHLVEAVDKASSDIESFEAGRNYLETKFASLCREINQVVDPEQQYLGFSLVEKVATSEALLEDIQRTARNVLGEPMPQGKIPEMINRLGVSQGALREQTKFIDTVRDLLGMPVSHLGDLAATLTEKLELLGEYSVTMDRSADGLTMALCKQEEAEQQLQRRDAALWELVNAMNYEVGGRAMADPKNILSTTQRAIANQCDHLKATLLEKNRKYGNSALEPVRLFSKADPVEQIRVRIDDKLSRMQSAQDDDTEDVETDLAGYLVLLKVAKSGAVAP